MVALVSAPEAYDGPVVVIPLGPTATHADGEAVKQMIAPLIGHFVSDRSVTLPLTAHLVARFLPRRTE